MSESRYKLPDPRCNHKPTGYIWAGDPYTVVGAVFMSHTVCDRQECIDDCMEWAKATNLAPITYSRYSKDPKNA